MMKNILIAVFGLLSGLLLSYYGAKFISSSKQVSTKPTATSANQSKKEVKKGKKVIGFLPFWLISKANSVYPKYLTDLSYFNLTISSDGSIVTVSEKGESDPGYYSLNSGKVDKLLNMAKENNLSQSIVVFSGDNEVIDSLLEDPTAHAKNLVNDVVPVMRQYNFTDLNLDIESTKGASPEAQLRFTEFVKEVKRGLSSENLGSLTLDLSSICFFKDYLVNPKQIEPYVDNLVIMAYDYHHPGSFVTGPVAPVGGADTIAEFDIKVTIKKALGIIPKEKIILGVPLYGYEWETLGTNPRSAVIPGSARSVSSQKVADLLATCTNCQQGFDQDAKESYVVFKDLETGTYHQIFYPDEKSTQEKIDLANTNKLGGIALWALGYEDRAILNPLSLWLSSGSYQK